MARSYAVGVGCFWFTAEQGDGERRDLRVEQDGADIRAILLEFQNISAVEILRDKSISAEIVVPIRLQESLAFGMNIGGGIERFKIILVEEYDGPVMFCGFEVGRDGDAGPHDLRTYNPSTAVVVVREYLKKNIGEVNVSLRRKRSNLIGVALETVGPSPFHADFVVFKQPPGAANELREAWPYDGGYKALECLLQGGDAFGSFVQEYSNFFSVFYDLMGSRDEALQIDIELSSELNKFGQHEVPSSRQRAFAGPKKWFYGVMRHIGWQASSEKLPFSTDKVLYLITMYKLTRGRMKEKYRARQEHLSMMPGKEILLPSIDRVISDETNIPHSEVLEICRTIESRRNYRFQNIATLASGLFGGVLGAIVAALVSYYSRVP